MQTLESQMKLAGIPVDSRCLDRMQAYHQLLAEAGAKTNLTAVKGWDNVRDQLILRSLRLTHALTSDVPELRLIDIGTGAGIPGLILKIANPRLQVTLVDSTGKKVEFVKAAIDALELEGAKAIHARAEDLAHSTDHRETYDFAIARSVGSLPVLAELLLPFVKTGGSAAALKSSGIDDEVARAAFAAGQMGGGPATMLPADTPGTAPADIVITWQKVTATPDQYPRRAGLPKHKPLLAPTTRETVPG